MNVAARLALLVAISAAITAPASATCQDANGRVLKLSLDQQIATQEMLGSTYRKTATDEVDIPDFVNLIDAPIPAVRQELIDRRPGNARSAG